MDASMADAEFVSNFYTGLPYNVVGTSEPITKSHALDKICIPILLLGYTLLQFFMVIYDRFARKRIILLFLLLSTWSLLCGEQRHGGAVVSFQSPVRNGNTVVGLISGDESDLLRSCLSEQTRPECSQTEKNWMYKDGLNFNGFGSYRPDVLFHSNFHLPGHLVVDAMSSSDSQGETDDDGYVRSSIKSVIKALSGTRFVAPPTEDPDEYLEGPLTGAEETDRTFTDLSLSG